MDAQTEICIIGAGVIGCAIARELALRKKQVVVLEKEQKEGEGITARNSEVIHAGIYYPRNSKKRSLCVEGRELLYSFCEQHRVPHKKCGKLIIASSENEREELHSILEQGKQNGVTGLSLISKSEIEKRAPLISAVEAIHSSESGIIDAHSFTRTLRRLAEEAGATFVTTHKVRSMSKTGSSFCIEGSSALQAELLINTAGLHANALQKTLLGETLTPKLYWVKGRYALIPKFRKKFSELVYPIPEKNLRGLGVHLTIDLHGEVRLGPDTLELLDHQEDYSLEPSYLSAFFDKAKLFLPSLELKDLVLGYAGIRPKLSAAGEPAKDFHIKEYSSEGFPGYISLLGIESPGLTSALAIAKEVSRMINC